MEILIAILIVALILFLLWVIATKLPFMAGLPLQIFGIVLAIFFIFYCAERLGVLDRVRL